MALLGKRNQLTVVRTAPPGFYLDGGTHGEILLPGRYIPSGAVPGDTLDVFVYRDSEDRLVATKETPCAVVGEFAFLQVVSVNPRIGVFLDRGLDKDLLLPRREQGRPLRPGDRVVVRIAVDEKSDRIIASARLNRWLNLTPPGYVEDQPVRLLITGETPLGYNAIVEHAHRGLLYHSDLTCRLLVGQQLNGYVRAVRADGKIDLTLNRAGYRRIAPLKEQIFATLKASGGRMPYHDNSPPEEIRATFGVSKKAFKQAIGALYRDHRILIEPSGIRTAPAGGEGKPIREKGTGWGRARK
ncbi:MAG: S1-like domain-containing RNA-binding protein [Opitutaceae bacterium]|nr:S1-like domain-containing RNA-binding protein [Opitutaceae bacterium]